MPRWVPRMDRPGPRGGPPPDLLADDAPQAAGVIVEVDFLLDRYRTIETAAAEMAAAACAGDWARVAATHRRCAREIARLDGLSPARPMNDHEQADRVRLLGKILAHDAVVRHLRQPAVLASSARHSY